MRRGGLYGLFFLSGASALAHELAWQRLLHLVFGVSTLATAAVLAAYMGGLALGGLLFGRLADRTSRPLRLYALVEAGLGLAALLVPPGFALLARWYTPLYESLQPGPWVGTYIRFALALLILGPPATLVGATLPLMSRLACGRAASLSSFSLLYAINTFGAVIDAGLTGFVLLHHLGLRQTIWMAASVNLFVAFVAVCAGQAIQAESKGEGPAPAEERGRSGQRLVLVAAALTGLTAMGLEVVWARVLGILTSNSAYGFALLLTVVLLGLTVGSLLQAWWSRRPGDNWMRLALCQLALAVAAVGGLSWCQTVPDWLVRATRAGTAAMFAGEFALTAGAVLLPALFMGMGLPLLVAGVSAGAGGRCAWIGRVYAANALGCVAGPFLAGFVLVPSLGIRATLGVLVFAALVVALIAWGLALRPGGFLRVAGAAVTVLVLVLSWVAVPAGVYTKSPIQEPRHLLYYGEGNNATVAVIEEPSGIRTILVDGQPVAGTSATSAVDQKMLAHLPLLLHPAPRRALTVGFGSGGTSHSMTRHGVDVDCVEIEGRVPGAADLFRSENHGVLEHPHFRLILDDARSWLGVAPVRYDVIVTDCTNIQYRSNGDLYTTDYFNLMKARLNAAGLAAAWVPANGIREDDLKTLLRSFRAVFPHMSVWYMNTLPTDFLIVVGTPGRLVVDVAQLSERMRRPNVAEDLKTVGLSDLYRLMGTLLTTEEKLDAYLGDGPLNTDDQPVLSYSAYGSALHRTIAANLLGLLEAQVDSVAFTRGGEKALLLRHQVASREALLGHIQFHLGNAAGALRHYVDGAGLLPDDAALHALVVETYADCLRKKL